MLSKYLVRSLGRPLFDPFNIALMLCFVALGSDRIVAGHTHHLARGVDLPVLHDHRTGERADRTYAMFEANGRFLLDGECDTARVFLD